MEASASNVPTEVRLAGAGLSLQERTQQLAGVTADLAERGVISGWRGELYPVLQSFDQAPLALLERAAAAHFGIKVGAAAPQERRRRHPAPLMRCGCRALAAECSTIAVTPNPPSSW